MCGRRNRGCCYQPIAVAPAMPMPMPSPIPMPIPMPVPMPMPINPCLSGLGGHGLGLGGYPGVGLSGYSGLGLGGYPVKKFKLQSEDPEAEKIKEQTICRIIMKFVQKANVIKELVLGTVSGGHYTAKIKYYTKSFT
ncbi:hypothetical protein BpHYR1_018218 [Brachionus plicatilis]|uniref:Uncharacterized protein n=1 Tax=Brachionus plicatilis TaxID=10195 RepID=A0A3M7Q3M8_BRAPC|nr:hypothetical protein BpHYR1_018218 [Brachionus plicatilis]